MVNELFKKVNLDELHTILYLIGILFFIFSLTENLKYLEFGIIFLVFGFFFSNLDELYFYSSFDYYIKDKNFILGCLALFLGISLIYLRYLEIFIFI